jgi:hypothetical protein
LVDSCGNGGVDDNYVVGVGNDARAGVHPCRPGRPCHPGRPCPSRQGTHNCILAIGRERQAAALGSNDFLPIDQLYVRQLHVQ